MLFTVFTLTPFADVDAIYGIYVDAFAGYLPASGTLTLFAVTLLTIFTCITAVDTICGIYLHHGR
jgi:hypothetical protein